MQITINIKAKDIADALENKVQWYIMNEYSDLALKAAGVTEASAVKTLREDAKYMAALEKRLVRTLTDAMDDVLLNWAGDVASPALKKLATQLDKAEKVVERKLLLRKKHWKNKQSKSA